MLTATIIVSEIGDISRFRDPPNLKMAGLNLRENSSGKHKGKDNYHARTQAPAGRAVQWRSILAHNEEFRQLHRNLTGEKNPLNRCNHNRSLRQANPCSICDFNQRLWIWRHQDDQWHQPVGNGSISMDSGYSKGNEEIAAATDYLQTEPGYTLTIESRAVGFILEGNDPA